MSALYPVPRNPYLVLGVAPTSPVETLKAAFRDLARKYHPDAQPEDPKAATERLKEATAALHSVSDQGRRKEVDVLWLKPRIPRGLTVGASTPAPGFLSRLFKLHPKDGPGSLYFVYMNAGLVCFKHPGLVLVEQAEIEFRRALEANPSAPEARFNLGLTSYWMGRFDEAFALLEELARRSSDDETVRRLAASLRPLD